VEQSQLRQASHLDGRDAELVLERQPDPSGVNRGWMRSEIPVGPAGEVIRARELGRAGR